jgi:hypothetical protein
VLKKPSRNSVADDVPDVRADEPERAMEQFTDGLRRVLAVTKKNKKAIRPKKSSPAKK